MLLSEQTKFAVIYSHFYNETHSLEDIGNLIIQIRASHHKMSDEAKKCMLEIPLTVLKEQVELNTDISSWTSSEGPYFAGNCVHNAKYKSIFESRTFNLDTMVALLEDIMDDPDMLNSDFYLRNPEVTLLHFVSVKEFSNFENCGLLFAHVMEEAFRL